MAGQTHTYLQKQSGRCSWNNWKEIYQLSFCDQPLSQVHSKNLSPVGSRVSGKHKKNTSIYESQNLADKEYFSYRTIDSLGVAYGKGKLTCFLGGLECVVDAVSSNSFITNILPSWAISPTYYRIVSLRCVYCIRCCNDLSLAYRYPQIWWWMQC